MLETTPEHIQWVMNNFSAIMSWSVTAIVVIVIAAAAFSMTSSYGKRV